MNIHTTEAITALQRTVRMTIPQIGEQAAQAYENMRAEAQARQLVVNGPSIFVAHSMPQDAHTEFELTFCLPVKGSDLPKLPAFRCACFMFEGPLDRLFTHGYQTYFMLRQKIINQLVGLRAVAVQAGQILDE